MSENLRNNTSEKSDKQLTTSCKNLLTLETFDKIALNFAKNGVKAFRIRKIWNDVETNLVEFEKCC